MAIVYPHDIVKVKEGVSLDTLFLPQWALERWHRSPYQVIRRAIARDNEIPIGIRGTSRGERFGSSIPMHWVEAVIRPQDLVVNQAWDHWIRADQFPEMLTTIEVMSDILTDIEWGIGGSLGYELTTGQATITDNSDLDIILYPLQKFSRECANKWLNVSDYCAKKVDLQVQTEKGAFHLVEYALGNRQILLKKIDGYTLIEDVWGELL